MTKYLFRPPKLIGLYALLSIITYGCSTIIFYAYSWITDATVGMNLAIACQTTAICAVVFVSLCAFLTLLSIVKRYILFYSTKQLRENVMSSIRSLSLGDFIARDDSYYTSMLLNDLNTVEDDYFANILELIGDSVQLIIMLGVIGQIGIEYLVVVALLCVPSVLQPFIMKKPLGKAGLAVSAQLQEYTGRVREYIYGFEAIKLARRENVFSNLFAVQTGKLEALKKRQAVIGALNGVLLMLAVYGLKVGSQLFFMRQSVVGAISVAVVAMLFGMANNVGNPAANILGYAAAIHSTKEIRSKITGFLSGKNKHDNGSKSLDSPIDEIRLSHVGFSYGDKAVLQDISLSFKRGAKYALVGESGCGKSTLIKLILGYYSDYKGSITINGHDVRGLTKKSICSHIAYIQQNTYIMSGTIRDNITLFKDYSDECIHAAVKAAGLEPLIQSLPDGLNSAVEQGGNNFSGGEKQRIAIARAYVAGAECFIVDEGASALDNVIAYDVEKTLLSLSGKTVISIIHRINNTVRMYDAIHVLGNGRVLHTGTYKELQSSEYGSVFAAESKENAV